MPCEFLNNPELPSVDYLSAYTANLEEYSSFSVLPLSSPSWFRSRKQGSYKFIVLFSCVCSRRCHEASPISAVQRSLLGPKPFSTIFSPPGWLQDQLCIRGLTETSPVRVSCGTTRSTLLRKTISPKPPAPSIEYIPKLVPRSLTDSPLCQLAGIQDEQFEINLILFNKIEADAEGTTVEDQHCRLLDLNPTQRS